ncbi:MAG TPA: hypothetical protein VJP88_04980 [Caulobacteraceae bacterium]|nr:hypothetical protein [Caulobacteraceae bacterium]
MSTSAAFERSRFAQFGEIAALLAERDEAVRDEATLEGLFFAALEGQSQHVRDTYLACLERPPEAGVDLAAYPDRRAAAGHLARAVMSDEFLGEFVRIATTAFPDAPRTFFLHIPKTAGSSVRTAFQEGGCHFVWDVSYANRAVLVEERGWPWLFRELGRQSAEPRRGIAVTGHMTAASLLTPGRVRDGDRAFTVVRRPEEAVVSALNYTFTTVLNHPGRADADAFGGWIRKAGFALPASPQDVTPEMAEAVLLAPDLSAEWSRLLLRYLSPDGTIAGALNAASTLRMDVVAIEALRDYMASQFQLPLPLTNTSHRFIPEFAALGRRARIHVLSEICREDLALYDVLVRLMGDDGVLQLGRGPF